MLHTVTMGFRSILSQKISWGKSDKVTLKTLKKWNLKEMIFGVRNVRLLKKHQKKSLFTDGFILLTQTRKHSLEIY